jgi:hypothetical protein
MRRGEWCGPRHQPNARRLAPTRFSFDIFQRHRRVLSRTDLKAADWAARVDAVNIFPVSAGDFPYFASFRVLKSSISAGQLHFSTGFDSRQHHRKGRRSAALFLLALSSASRVLRAGGLPGLDGFRSLSALTPVAEGVDGQADQLR